MSINLKRHKAKDATPHHTGVSDVPAPQTEAGDVELQTYALSTYPGERAMVVAHPSNYDAQWYRREDVQKRIAELQKENERLKDGLETLSTSRGQWMARAESAEARVKELEQKLKESQPELIDLANAELERKLRNL